jgi:hypothetical protein
LFQKALDIPRSTGKIEVKPAKGRPATTGKVGRGGKVGRPRGGGKEQGRGGKVGRGRGKGIGRAGASEVIIDDENDQFMDVSGSDDETSSASD